jgi:hypothetical protein
MGLNGGIRSDEMTRFIYALKEIRACLEAEVLMDVQQRLAVLSREISTRPLDGGDYLLGWQTTADDCVRGIGGPR